MVPELAASLTGLLVIGSNAKPSSRSRRAEAAIRIMPSGAMAENL